MKKRPEWAEVTKNLLPAAEIICSCTQRISTIEALSMHYNLGHMDYEVAAPMTEAHMLHLGHLLGAFDSMFSEKYKQGVAEHGGGLWNLSALQLMDNAIKENLDQFAYLMTLRGQIEKLVKLTEVIQVPDFASHQWIPTNIQGLYSCQVCKQRSDSPAEYLKKCQKQ